MTLKSVCGGKVGVSMLGAFELLCPISSSLSIDSVSYKMLPITTGIVRNLNFLIIKESVYLYHPEVRWFPYDMRTREWPIVTCPQSQPVDTQIM